jgi:hypothetical protein
MVVIMDPVKLTGLDQVTYVMGCFVKNDNEALIVKMLASDVQLHNMRNLFLHPNRRMTNKRVSVVNYGRKVE